MDNKGITITVEATIDAPVKTVWAAWTTPEDIQVWNHASDDWHCPLAENDLRVGGKFMSRMAAKDGSFSFDFSGVHDVVTPYTTINSTLDDDRKMSLAFSVRDGKTIVRETFEAENENSIELQQTGWQMILDNFKAHVEKSWVIKNLKNTL